jgi:hypothetical protein
MKIICTALGHEQRYLSGALDVSGSSLWSICRRLSFSRDRLRHLGAFLREGTSARAHTDNQSMGEQQRQKKSSCSGASIHNNNKQQQQPQTVTITMFLGKNTHAWVRTRVRFTLSGFKKSPIKSNKCYCVRVVSLAEFNTQPNNQLIIINSFLSQDVSVTINNKQAERSNKMHSTAAEPALLIRTKVRTKCVFIQCTSSLSPYSCFKAQRARGRGVRELRPFIPRDLSCVGDPSVLVLQGSVHMCLFMWRDRWSDREKARSHRWHWKGRSPVCLR